MPKTQSFLIQEFIYVIACHQSHSLSPSAAPCVAVCIDGSDPSYLALPLRGELPNIARFIREGFAGTAQSSVPAFTCPNNMSIITGVPVSQHGISGNYYLDTKTWEPVVMTDPKLLMAETILSGFADAGARVVSITAKDKLRRQLKGSRSDARQYLLFGRVRGSMHRSKKTALTMCSTLCRRTPARQIFRSAFAFVLQAGLKLLRDRRPEVMYLSLTDFVQHRYAPEAPEALSFYQKLDALLAGRRRYQSELTADHGMSDMESENLEPHVLWLQDILDATGKGEARSSARSRMLCQRNTAPWAVWSASGAKQRFNSRLYRTISALPEVDI